MASKREANGEECNGCFTARLPDSILMDIFSRLSPKSIFCCRCVCKTWYSLLCDPYFSKLHLSRARNTLMIVSYEPASELEPHPARMKPVLSMVEFNTNSSICSAFKLNPKNFPYEFRNRGYWNFCNGFVLLWDVFAPPGVATCVFNPVLGDFTTLPETPGMNNLKIYLHCVLGFSPRTQQHKVLRVFIVLNKPDCWTSLKDVDDYDLEMPKAEIHTLGSGIWRSVDDCCLPRRAYNAGQSYVHLNGIVHWINKDEEGTQLLLFSFDMDNEKFRTASLPSELNDNVDPGFSKKLLVLHGYLSICRNLYCVEGLVATAVEIWMMKNYGVHESWTRQFFIELPDFKSIIPKPCFCSLTLVECLSNGEFVFHYSNTDILMAYHPVKGSCRHLEVPGIHHNYFHVLDSHLPSFVAVRNIISREKEVPTKYSRDGSLISGVTTISDVRGISIRDI